MKVCTFETMNLSVPMIDIEGTLYTSSAVLAETFGISPSAIKSVIRRNRDRFSGSTVGDVITVAECNRKALQDTLSIQRLRTNTVLWSHRDLIHLGLLLTGDTARAFQEDVIDLIEQQARVNYVPKSQFKKLVLQNTEMTNFCNTLAERVEKLEAMNREMASNAGRTLRLVKG